jgi:hypothetical protein
MSNTLRPIWTSTARLASMTIVLQENLSECGGESIFKSSEINKFEKEARKYFDDNLVTARIQALTVLDEPAFHNCTRSNNMVGRT